MGKDDWVPVASFVRARWGAWEADYDKDVLKGDCEGYVEYEHEQGSDEWMRRVRVYCAPGTVVYFSADDYTPPRTKRKYEVCEVKKDGEVTCYGYEYEYERYPGSGRIAYLDFKRNFPFWARWNIRPSKVVKNIGHDLAFVRKVQELYQESLEDEADLTEEELHGRAVTLSHFGSEEQAIEAWEEYERFKKARYG